MTHLFRVYFDSVSDAVEVFAMSHDDAAEYVSRSPGRDPSHAVTRYVKSVDDATMRADLRKRNATWAVREMRKTA